jgi:hypothetical protein
MKVMAQVYVGCQEWFKKLLDWRVAEQTRVYARQSPPSLRKHCRHARNHDKCLGTQNVQGDKHWHGCSSFLSHSYSMKQNITHLCGYFNQFTLNFMNNLITPTCWKVLWWVFLKVLKTSMETLLSTKCDFGLPAWCKSDLRYLGISGFYAAYNGSFWQFGTARSYRNVRKKLPFYAA